MKVSVRMAFRATPAGADVEVAAEARMLRQSSCRSWVYVALTDGVGFGGLGSAPREGSAWPL